MQRKEKSYSFYEIKIKFFVTKIVFFLYKLFIYEKNINIKFITIFEKNFRIDLNIFVFYKK